MSGHSKWHSIKHKKAAEDAKRANIFTKLAKDISVAAREGGEPEMNFRLRMAIDKAKALNLPKENIERAIKKGTGELSDGAQIEELIYEAYGPGQIAMLIQVVTDNKNRTLSEVKNILQKNNGKFVEGGSVSWQFEQVGVLEIKIDGLDLEEIEMAIIESGAKNYTQEEDYFEVYTQAKDLQNIKEKLENNFKTTKAELSFLAKNKIAVDDSTIEKYQKLVNALEENDDVANVYDNIE